MLVLTQALEQCLALRWSEGHQLVADSKAPPISQEVSQDVIEILKTIFNIAHRFYRQEPDEVRTLVWADEVTQTWVDMKTDSMALETSLDVDWELGPD